VFFFFFFSKNAGFVLFKACVFNFESEFGNGRLPDDGATSKS